LKTCPFIIADNHKWYEITEQDIEKYYFKFEKMNLKSKLISVIRKEYFLDILSGNLFIKFYKLILFLLIISINNSIKN
jgi:hypothetical protein